MHIEVKMPDIGVDEVEIIEILVKIHDEIKLDQALVIVEGDKVSMEIPSPICGFVKDICVKVGQKVTTSSIIMIFDVNDINSNTSEKKFEKIKLDKLKNKNSKKNNIKKHFFSHATPVIRRLARDLNINLDNVIASGPKNRILKEDIESYIKKSITKKDLFCQNSTVIKNFNETKSEEVLINNLQRVIGKNLHKNWMNIPHVTQFDEVNITILEEFRQKYNFEEKQKNNTYLNITILPFVIKAVAHALLKFRVFNSSLSTDKKSIIFKKYINIGIAIDVKNSLFVPTLKNVDKKNITNLSSELSFLAEKAHNNKLNPSDMQNGTFTISNLGGIGGTCFTPIINSNEVAILGISKSIIKPLWDGKKFSPSLMLPLSLSYDHRVINGAEAARFITFIGKLLSDIRFLIM
ncbi:2-oxo acid dehydrogenase subunit E2 [Buchnera aphidicola]|uniref:2-oxo acid dehydrogenase subunit E2 n=1 Tax=Buchnera aphidicola TaxID=9 RepID=UPI003464A91D